MPVAAAIGAAIAVETVGATIVAAVGSQIVGTAIAGAIGGAIAGGIGAEVSGGKFSDGFLSGAVGGAISGGISGYAAGQAASGLGGELPGTALADVGTTTPSGLTATANSTGSLNTGFDLGSGLEGTSAVSAAPSSFKLPDLLSQGAPAQLPSTLQAPTDLASAIANKQAAEAAQAGVAPSLSSLGTGNSAVSSNAYGAAAGTPATASSTGGLGGIFKNIDPLKAGAMATDYLSRARTTNDARRTLENLTSSANAQGTQLMDMGTNIVNQRQQRAIETKAKIDAVMAKWGAR